MNKIGTVILRAVTMLVLLLIFCILYKILKKGLPDYEIDAGGGIGPFLLNSIYVLLLSLAVSIPVGMLAGIFLAEYAPNNKFTEFIRMSVESLASVPSIVFGLFGYVLFVEVFHIGVTIIGAAITLGLINLPLLTRV